ncbi:MAG: DNA polymerase III subunit gamma/tau [bacterium]
MNNLVLYRKYRPKSFSEITGQEHVVQTLTNALDSNMISHAYLFCGPRGSGKTSIARIFAKAVNCEQRKDKEAEPCNKCSSCLEINEGKAIDLIEIDAASHTGVEDIRDLIEGIRFTPTRSKYKVFIVDESHQLSKSAANALLKTLEEPPSHAIFILATTEIHKMIPTIISRCQRFDFRKLTLLEIVSRLEYIAKKEKVKIEKPALELIALSSGGAARDAEGLLDQVLTFKGILKEGETIKADDIKDLLGMVDTKLMGEFVDLLCQREVAKAIEFLNKVLEKGKDIQEFTRALVYYLRQGLILKIESSLENPIIVGLTKEEQEKLQKQVVDFTEQDLQRILKLFMEAENKMKYSSIPQLPLELAIVEALQKEEK